MVPSGGIWPKPLLTPSVAGAATSAAVSADVPLRLVPVRAREVLLRDAVVRFVELAALRRVEPVAPVRPVLRLVVARAPVRPEALRRVLLVLRLAAFRRVPVERFAVAFRVALRTALRAPVARFATARFAVPRFAVARRAVLRAPVVRLAAVRRVVAFLRPVVRLTADFARVVFLRAPVVARFAVERRVVALRAVVRLTDDFFRVVAFLRVPVERFAVVRRVPVERDAVALRRVPVERLRDAVVFRAAVDRVELDLLRAVAMCLLLVGEFGGNNYSRSMRAAPAVIPQKTHLSYLEMSSTAMSRATSVTVLPLSSERGFKDIRLLKLSVNASPFVCSRCSPFGELPASR